MSTRPEVIEVASPVATPEEAAPVAIDKPVHHSSVPFPQNRKKTLVFVGLILCVIGLVVGLGVGLSNKNKSDDNDETTTTTTMTTKESLELVCIVSEDLDACRAACEVAACCFETPVAESCLQDEDVSCDDYEPCLVLTEEDGDNDEDDGTGSDTALEEPSEQVQTICQGDYNAELTCEEVCQPAACCPEYLEDDSCYEGNEEVCDLWLDAGCFNLGINEQDPEEDGSDSDSAAALEEPTSDVETVCNGEYNADLTCEEVCEPAACCPEYLGEDSCYEGNEEVCDRWLDAGCFNIAVDFAQP